jgi:hypothetical protein
MVMEYLLVWLEDVTSPMYLVKHLKSKWEKVGLTFGLITLQEGDTEEQKKRIGTYVQFQDTEGQEYVLLLFY